MWISQNKDFLLIFTYYTVYLRDESRSKFYIGDKRFEMLLDQSVSH